MVAAGLIAYAGGLYGLIASGWFAASLAAVLFAFGYGVILPTCVAWATAHYPTAERARPVALVNTSFNLGSIVAVQAAGALLPVIGWSGVLIVLGVIIASVFVIVAASRSTRHARAT